MVLESLGLPKEYSRGVLPIIVLAFIVVSLSLLTSLYMDERNSSILAISFIVIAFVPMMHSLFVKAERKEVSEGGFITKFFVRHKKLISIYFLIFVGIILSYSVWYVLMPSEYRGVFGEQDRTLGIVADMREVYTGNAIADIGSCGKNSDCWREMIFSHNLTVMLLFIILSFLYGAGALYLTVWNASTLGVLIGKQVLSKLSLGIGAGITQGLLAFIGLAGHGIPEAGAYFLGAIAGGILSVAIISPKYGWDDLKIIIYDVLFVLIVAVILLWVGAAIEGEILVSSLG